MIINSDQCQSLFPSNKAYHFRTHLKAPLSLQGTWKVALTEIYITESSPLPYKKLYLYSNICGDSIVAGEYHPLLRRLINDHVGYWAEIYELPNYVPVKRSEITHIEFYIKDEAGNYASRLTNPSHCISGLFHFTINDDRIEPIYSKYPNVFQVLR